MIQQLCLWVLSWASLEVGYWLLSVATLLLYLIHWPFAAYIHIYIALCLSVACWLSLYAIDICYSCCPYALSDPLAFPFLYKCIPIHIIPTSDEIIYPCILMTNGNL